MSTEPIHRPQKMLGLNTVVTILTALAMGVIGFLSRESYQEMRAAHDDILTVKLLMVRHNEFDIAIAEMKQKTTQIDAQLSSIRSRQQSIEIEIQKLKDNRP